MPEEDLQGQGTEGEQQGQVSEGQDNSLLEGLLKDVPDEHRPVIEQYWPEWNKNVNNKFQQIHESYKGYKDLGDLDELQTARQYLDILRTSPQDVLDALVEEFQSDPEGQKILAKYFTQQQQSTGTPKPEELPAEFQGLPKEFVEKYQKQEQLLAKLAQAYLGDDEARRVAEQDAQLDDYLEDLHKKHGAFDNDYFMLQMHRTADEAASLAAAKKFVVADEGQQRGSAPPVISGGGYISSGQQKVAEMKNDDLDSLVAGILNQALSDNS